MVLNTKTIFCCLYTYAVMGNIDSGVGETNSVENPSEQAEVASLQMQQSSSGSGNILIAAVF